MTRKYHVLPRIIAIVSIKAIVLSEGSTNPSSIMLPNVGPDTGYQIAAVDLDGSVTRSLAFYTITFSAAGLFILLCIIFFTTAEYYKAQAQRPVVVPSDDDFESEEEEEVEIAVITPPVETADCGSQYEDLKVQEENILTWKKKLRVKRRKVVSTQPLTPYGDGKRLEYSLALPQITPGGSNLLQQSTTPLSFSTPIKHTRLDVINYTVSTPKPLNLNLIAPDTPTTATVVPDTDSMTPQNTTNGPFLL